jgi:hypothetical protein
VVVAADARWTAEARVDGGTPDRSCDVSLTAAQQLQCGHWFEKYNYFILA